MNKVYLQIFLILVFSVYYSSANAQEWSFGGELGATVFSFFDYTSVYQEGGSFERGYSIPHNEAWVLSYYPKDKKYFFSLAHTHFNAINSDVLVRSEEGRILQQISTGTFNSTTLVNMGYQFDVGRHLGFKDQQLFFAPLYGFGIEWLRSYSITPSRGLLNKQYETFKTGINPSLQSGFRLSYRYKRSRFSVKALGNLGLHYHTETQYQVLLPQETIFATIRGKNDFIAAQASYEYVFKSSVAKSKQKINTSETFSRDKIQELRIGFHPFNFLKQLSLNYELFPTKQKKSIFIDLAYLSVRNIIVYSPNIPLEGLPDFYKEPFLDIMIGRNLYHNNEKGRGWGVGYYLRSEFRVARNKDYVRDLEIAYSQEFNWTPYVYGALGMNLQYKCLIKDRWIIAPIVLADLGIASNDDLLQTKYQVFLRPLLFDVQARLYLGYRF
ncbi:MAG: hypothetical protein AAGG68_01445 [Bacteroidota bacterium]